VNGILNKKHTLFILIISVIIFLAMVFVVILLIRKESPEDTSVSDFTTLNQTYINLQSLPSFSSTVTYGGGLTSIPLADNGGSFGVSLQTINQDIGFNYIGTACILKYKFADGRSFTQEEVFNISSVNLNFNRLISPASFQSAVDPVSHTGIIAIFPTTSFTQVFGQTASFQLEFSPGSTLFNGDGIDDDIQITESLCWTNYQDDLGNSEIRKAVGGSFTFLLEDPLVEVPEPPVTPPETVPVVPEGELSMTIGQMNYSVNEGESVNLISNINNLTIENHTLQSCNLSYRYLDGRSIDILNNPLTIQSAQVNEVGFTISEIASVDAVERNFSLIPNSTINLPIGEVQDLEILMNTIANVDQTVSALIPTISCLFNSDPVTLSVNHLIIEIKDVPVAQVTPENVGAPAPETVITQPEITYYGPAK